MRSPGDVQTLLAKLMQANFLLDAKAIELT